ncbi:MAG: hypothetical protein ACFFCZ_06765 [Promethearchaeota archaeon]
MTSEIKPAFSMELASFKDLVRFVTSNVRGGHIAKIFKWEKNEKVYYATFATFQGYFEFKALPIWFFVSMNPTKDQSEKSFVGYDLQTGKIAFFDTLEEVDLTAIQRELVRLVPVIRLKNPPEIFSENNKTN